MYFRYHKELVQTQNNIQNGEDNMVLQVNDQNEKRLTRKRKRNVDDWKNVSRKRLRQAGKQYINSKKKVEEEKKHTYKICDKCLYKCSNKISTQKAKTIFEKFWKLSDNEKFNYYDKTTSRLTKKRVRKENKLSTKPRAHSFIYYFNIEEKRERVCREFYLKVLGISARRIAYFHSHKKEGLTRTPQKDKRGVATKGRLPEDVKDTIREHINKFPRVPGHYCRANTQKEYLEFGLNMSKMYQLFVEYCKEVHKTPAKKWLYTKIFNEEFNISFHTPKKDQCDTCCEFTMQSKDKK